MANGGNGGASNWTVTSYVVDDEASRLDSCRSKCPSDSLAAAKQQQINAGQRRRSDSKANVDSTGQQQRQYGSKQQLQ